MNKKHIIILFCGAVLPVAVVAVGNYIFQYYSPYLPVKTILFINTSFYISSIISSVFIVLFILRLLKKEKRASATAQHHLLEAASDQSILKRSEAQVLKVASNTDTLPITENLYRDLFENMPNGFAYCKLIFEAGALSDYQYINVNKAHELFTGLKNVIGKNATDIIPGINDNFKEFFDKIRNIIRTDIPETFEIYLNVLDRWFKVTVFCPDKEHIILLTDDITERKKSEERYRTHIERISDSFAAMDLNGCYTYVNKKMGEMSGRSPESLIGKNAWEEFPDLVNSAAYEAVNNAIKRQQHIYHVDYYPSLDIWYESNYYPSPNGISIFSRDITLQKKAEARQALFVSIVNSSNDAILSNDLNSIIMSWNNGATKLFGYTGSEVIGKNNAFLIPVNRVEEEEKIIGLIKAGEDVRSFETQRVKKDGTLVDIFFNISPIKDENNKVIGVSKIAGNITERNLAKRQLESSLQEKQQIAEQLSVILNTLPAHIALLNEEGEIIEVNNAWANLAENNNFIGNKNIIGCNYLQNIQNITGNNKAVADVVAEGIKLVLQKKLPGYAAEYPCNLTDSTVWYKLIVTPITEKTHNGAVVMYLNVTKQKINEAEILVSNDRFETLSKAANDGIWDLNLLTKKVWWNKSMYKIIGANHQLLLPSTIKLMRFIHPADRKIIIQNLKSILTTQVNFWENEVRYKLPHGKYGIILDRAYIIRDNNFKPLRVVGVSIDITQQKLAEEKLLLLNIQLQKRAQQLQESNADLEQFAYIASHDLHEPLRMVTSFLQLLEKKYKDQIDETASSYIWYAVDGATRMRKIIYDLLEYSRIGKTEVLNEKVDTNQIINDVLLLQSKIFEETKAVVKWNNLPTITANKSAMVQVFQNLIANAIKYQTPGVIPKITITAIETATHWRFQVSDNGIGIAPKFFDTIFIIFQRLHSRNEYPGTGIGLAICKKIIENHQGKIWVTSFNNQGTNFYFTISKILAI